MSYQQALEAAGATVLAFESFGSYQGDWYAKVVYQGEIGWIGGNYGSCSGCDAFQAEFGWDEDYCEDHEFAVRDAEGCPACAAAKAKYQQRLAAFGRTYLDGIYPQEKQEEVLREQCKDEYWGDDYAEALKFVEANK